jgi:hypothetical protein
MSHRTRRTITVLTAAGACALLAGAVLAAGSPAAGAPTSDLTTAWQAGHFAVDPAGVVGESDIVLGQANTQPDQSMPLGDGQLGAAVWAANGMTVQLNRADSMPYRRSPGWVVIPGLATLADAQDFHGSLDLYNGELVESGGGMTATTFIEPGRPVLVVSVTGADPNTVQTADIELWQPRTPAASASGAIGALAQTWTDSGDPAYPGGSGRTFGTLAAITASGRDVQASVVNPLTVQVSFKPDADGSYRILVAAPQWSGGNALARAQQLLAAPSHQSAAKLSASTGAWWHRYWNQVDPMQISSADGTGQYMENLRTIYLYAAAAERGSGDLAGSQAGTADLFSWLQDDVQWDPAAYWVWNQRMQLVADQGAGVPFLNDPFFAMYATNVANIRAWTEQQFPGMPGLCVPETMRFNGNGYSNGTQAYNGGTHAMENLSCSSLVPPTYNGENITSGAEISLYAWWQYLDTDDRSFLAGMYPLMAGVAQFLLGYATPGPDGLLHTVANAHETQWEVQDPTTDIAAMRAVFPVIIKASKLLGQNAGLVAQMQSALRHLPAFPRADAATETELLPPSADAGGDDVIAESYQPSAPRHNTENIGLETVWPYKLTGPFSPGGNDAALALRTFNDRLFVDENDWSFDAVDAAQLGLAAAVAQNLVAITEKYQKYPSGMAQFSGAPPYVEQSANVALALQTALVQDDAGVVRVAPAWPAGWDVAGAVAIPGRSRVDVQVEGGTVTTVAIEAGSDETIQMASPWPGQQVQVLEYHGGGPGQPVGAPASAEQFTIAMRAGGSYLVEPVSQPTTALPFSPVTGQPATSYKTLGTSSIGLPPVPVYGSLAAAYDNVGVTSDTDTAPGNFDGDGSSFAAQALASAGVSPGGSLSYDGITFSWPGAGPGTPDNVVASGQQIDISGSGAALGFLAAGSYGTASGTGTIYYSDGTAQSFTLSVPDWYATPPAGTSPVIQTPYRNRPGNTQDDHPVGIYEVTVPLQAGEQVVAVRLPDVSSGVADGTTALHVFAVGFGA